MIDPDLATRIVRRVRWDLPALRGSLAHLAWQRGDVDTAATALIRHLRERPLPDLGFSSDYAAAVREQADEAYKQRARRQIDSLLVWGPLAMRHFGLGPLQPEMLLAAAVPGDYTRFGNDVAAHRGQWTDCDWGCSHTIFRYLQTVWREPRCGDHALVPVLAWLLDRLDAEWTRSRQWAEDTLGSSGHNWWVCQFAGFWKAAVFLPEFAGLADFGPMASAHLERELDLLFGTEGFSREGSLLYHLVAVAVLQDWARLARRNLLPVSARVAQRLRDFAAIEVALITPDGVPPALGDFAETFGRGWGVNRLMHWAAITGDPAADAAWRTLPRPEKEPAEHWSGEFLFTCSGESLSDRSASTTPLPALPPPDVALPDSGLYVMRQNWTAASDYLLIDAMVKGELVGSHAHDGAMHLVFYSRGTPVLVDGGGGWQHDSSADHLRVQAVSHNVATVDGQGHCGLRGPFRFERVVPPRVDRWLTAPDYAYFSGVHEAYARPDVGVAAVRRKVFYLRGEYLLILDRFTASDGRPHVYTQHFHLGLPGRWMDSGRQLRTSGNGGNALICPVALAGTPLTTTLAEHAAPMTDLPNPLHAQVSLTAAGHGVMGVVVVPFAGGTAPVVDIEAVAVQADGRRLSPWEATGLAITVNGRRDVYVDWHMAWTLPWQADGHIGTAPLFHSLRQVVSPPLAARMPPTDRTPQDAAFH